MSKAGAIFRDVRDIENIYFITIIIRRIIKMNLLSFWLDHNITIDENCCNDGNGEDGMSEDVDGDPPDGMERREEVEGFLGGKAVDRAAFRDDDERLLVEEVGVDVTDGGAGEFQGELAKAPRQVIA